MDIVSAYNNQIDIQSLLVNSTNGINRANNNDSKTKTANYAQKGEPMYMAEMDADEDGTVTLDEFKDYCKSKGISSSKMVKMSQMSYAYRVMEAEEGTIDYISKLIPNAFPKLKQSQSGYSKQSENKYKISDNSGNGKMVSYKEYMKYCQQNTISDKLKTNTTVKDSNNGNLEISNPGKAVKSYKNNSWNSVNSTFEKAV